jgi:methionyl aminopeptidase
LDARRVRSNNARMVETLSPRELEKMRAAARAAVGTLDVVERFLAERPQGGISTGDIDALVRKDTAERGGTPSQLGYHGFTGAVCTSRNEVVCHGVPSAQEHVRRGDIINVDVTTCLDGYHGDLSRTFFVGGPDACTKEARHVVATARACLEAGIAVVKHGARFGDIGAAIVELARKAGCSVVRDFGGHGIGRAMHLDPHVSHVGERGKGPRMVEGQAFTIEPMINLGRPEVVVCDDGWRVVTADGSLSAQFEHTIVVTRTGCEVLTRS